MAPDSNGFTGEFYQIFKKENINPSQAISVSRGKTTSHPILQGWYYPVTKARRTHLQKATEQYLSGIQTEKSLTKHQKIESSNTEEGLINTTWDLYRNTRLAKHPQIKVIYPIDGLPRWLSWYRIRLPMQEQQESRVRSLGWKIP